MRRWKKQLLASAAEMVFFALSLIPALASEDVAVGNGWEKKEYTGEEATIRFSWWGDEDRMAATLAVVVAFEEEYPMIHVIPEFSGISGYHELLRVELEQGKAPDLMQIDAKEMESLENANPAWFADWELAGFDFSDYEEAFLQLPVNGSYGEVQLGIPVDLDGSAMIVNEEFSDEIGIDLTEAYSWDDLIEWGLIVREYDDEMYLLCAGTPEIAEYIVTLYAKQLTGKTAFDETEGVLNITEEQLAECFQYVAKLYENEVVPSVDVSAAYDWNRHQDPGWIDGRYLCSFARISEMDEMLKANEEVGWLFGLLPMMEEAMDDGWTADCTQVIALSSGCEHPEAAVLFADYLLNHPDSVSTLGLTRGIPASETARTVCEEERILDESVTQASEIALNYAGLTSDGYWSSDDGKNIVTEAIEQIGSGEKTPEEAAAEVMLRLQELIPSVTE